MQKRKPHSSSKYPIEDKSYSSVSKNAESRQPVLVNWDDLPPFLQDNEYIHTHYRPQSNSYLLSISSLKYLHNQTGNIYTQLLFFPIILLFSLPLYSSDSPFPAPEKEDLMVFGYFLVSLLATTGMSGVFHTICNHSPEVLDKALNLDFLGLLGASSGGFVVGLWYTFYCLPGSTRLYLIAMNISAQGLTAYFVLFVPVFRTPSWRPVRSLVFGSMALLAFVPPFFGLLLHGVDEMVLLGGKFYVLAALLDLLCGAFYALRFPEKWAPGKFDIWGHSHQWFHITGSLGMLAHICASIQAFNHRKKGGKC